MADLGRVTPGLSGAASLTVGAEHLATRVGSGTIEVFASPMMIALMEAACVDAVEALLPPGHVTLGTHLDVAHTAATPAGARVTAQARLTAVDGRKLTFAVTAEDGAGAIGGGTHTRIVVDRERFTQRLSARRAT